MSSEQDEAVGRTVSSIVRKEFESVDLNQGMPATMLAGFTASEAAVIVTMLDGFEIPGVGIPVDIVVCANPDRSEIPSRYLLDRSRRTMTWHRNNNRSGLVLVDVDPQGDQQGVVAMHLLTDNEILDPDLDDHVSRANSVTSSAWTVVASGALQDPPQSLQQVLGEVLEGLRRSRRQSLRQWVAFCMAASRAVSGLDRAVTMEEVRDAVSSSLPVLGLFPDNGLFEKTQGVSRRLERNASASQLLTPQGKELREEELSELIERYVTSGSDGQKLGPEQMAPIRSLMREIRENGGPTLGCSVDLALWEELFSSKSEAVGLGLQIRRFLETTDPTRLGEFDDLEVEAGLDEGDSSAAEKLLRSAPLEDRLPLADALQSTIRKKVERLVYRGERRSDDPLITLLYGLKALEAPLTEEPGGRVIALTLENALPAPSSEALFGFLYGRTLAEIADSCDGSLGNKFEVDPRLRTVADLRAAIAAPTEEIIDDRDIDQDSEQWAALRFVLTSSDTRTPLIRFRWEPRDQPGLLAFAHLVADEDMLGSSSIPSLDGWLATAFDRWQTPLIAGTGVSDSDDEVAKSWSTLRREHYSEWAAGGLSAGGIQAFLDEWEPLLREARTRYVPHGGPLQTLERFLSFETASCGDGRSVLFASHPLRLRWIGAHLAKLSRAIQAAVAEELVLNSENDRLYFNWFEHVSPHRQPPLYSARVNALQTSVREEGWHEEYAAVVRETSKIPDWLSGVDEMSVNELVATARSFLEAFPQKTTGLSVLILARAGAASLARTFVERLRQREQSTTELELHVLTPLADHSSVGKALGHLDSDEGRGQILMPPFRLVLHDWDGQSLGALDDLDGRIDIALAPNLFGLNTTPLPETRRNEQSIGGHFDPWLDPTTHLRPPSKDSINVSQVLLPPAPDPGLEAWSTLAVRRSRQAPVSAQDPEATDFITLQVQFDQNEELFIRLHSVALWVVTLDPFVGRDQIDALRKAPDVITVKSGVGKNETYTLVVSSSAGSDFVIKRLERRLRQDFDIAGELSPVLARRLYEIGRFVVPGLMLRAVGLGRTTEEILGLILARHTLDLAHPTSEKDGVEYWISLDERASWFGGLNQVRPDLLRVRAYKHEDATRIELLVVESKFRRQYDLGTADQQVARALGLFRSAFVPQSAEQPDDADFWRRELLSAIDELSRRPADRTDLPAVRQFGNGMDEDVVRSDLRAGRVDFQPAEGLVFAVAWAQDIQDPPQTTPAGTPLMLLDRVRVRQSLAVIARVDEIQTSSVPDDGQSPPAHVTDDFGSTSFPPPDPTAAKPAPTDELPTEDPGNVLVDDATTGGITARSGRQRMTRAVLESRYQRILDRLTQLQVKVRPPSEADRFQEGPAFCIYRVVPEQGMATDRVMGRLEDMKLALELPRELNLRAYVDRGSVVIEVPKEPADRYYVTAQHLWDATTPDPDALSVPIGEDIEGRTVSIDFSSPDTPHLLIAGQTGSGKSIALESILAGLCHMKTPAELRLLLVDPKSTELVDFSDDPHLLGEIGWDSADAIEILDQGLAEMERRYDAFRARKVRTLPDFNRAADDHKGRLPWWVIVLDEYADLTSDGEDRKAIEQRLKRLAQKGRAAGVHLIVATQKPAAEVISTVIRSNLPAQLGLRVKTATDSRIILDESGAEALAGSGDAFLKTARGMQRLQCAKVSWATQEDS